MYDFTTRVDRTGTGSSKWDAMYQIDPAVPADIVPLSVADMEFVEAPEIREAICSFAADAVLGYTGPTDAYYRSVIEWQERRHGWETPQDWIALSPGVVPAVATAVRAFTRPGDGVIIMPPVYYPFRSSIEKAGRTVVEDPLLLDEEHLCYTIDLDGLEKLCCEPTTTMLVFCSPHNPVGRVWSEEELAQVVQICCDNGVFICSDEIHNDLIMPGYRHTVIATVGDETQLGNCAVLTAPSKTFNLAGLQCSNIFIPDPDRKRAFEESASTYASFHTLNAFTYPVCEAVYTKCAAWLDEAIGVIADNHRLFADFCAERLPQLKVYPLEGTYLQWVDFRALGLSASELEAFTTKDALLFLDEGVLFGREGAGFERFNIACPQEVLREALERLENAVRRRFG